MPGVAPVCLVRSRERAKLSRAPTTTTAPKASAETAPLCSGCPCSSEDPPCIIEAYSTSSCRYRYTLAGACACRETSEFIAFDPAVVPTRPKYWGRGIEQIGE